MKSAFVLIANIRHTPINTPQHHHTLHTTPTPLHCWFFVVVVVVVVVVVGVVVAVVVVVVFPRGRQERRRKKSARRDYLLGVAHTVHIPRGWV